MRKGIVFGILVILLAGQIIAFIIYRNRQKREVDARMKRKVESTVAEYVRLNVTDSVTQDTSENNDSSAGDSQKKPKSELIQ